VRRHYCTYYSSAIGRNYSPDQYFSSRKVTRR
jgi:hypothetical protein